MCFLRARARAFVCLLLCALFFISSARTSVVVGLLKSTRGLCLLVQPSPYQDPPHEEEGRLAAVVAVRDCVSLVCVAKKVILRSPCDSRDATPPLVLLAPPIGGLPYLASPLIVDKFAAGFVLRKSAAATYTTSRLASLLL